MSTLDRRFISLFSGAGGLDLGLEQAGWNCIYASDVDKASIETLRQNSTRENSRVKSKPSRTYEIADILTLEPTDLLNRLNLETGELPLLAGGPPCQAWSSAGSQKGFDDPRGQLAEAYINLAAELRPRLVLFENVRGLLTARGRDGIHGSALASLRDRFSTIGYHTTVQLLNSADFGVPQRRVRLFIIAYRDMLEPSFPLPTHSKATQSRTSLLGTQAWINLGSIVLDGTSIPEGELVIPTAAMKESLSEIPNGKGLKSPGKKETTRPGGHWGYKQGAFIADPKQPARTVTTSSQQDWIRDENIGLRRLTLRESAAIQGFPDHYKFSGSKTEKFKQVGNAVPPPLGKAMGLSLSIHLERESNYPTRTSETLSKRSRSPTLPKSLQAAIDYSRRDHLRNGQSRMVATRSSDSEKRRAT